MKLASVVILFNPDAGIIDRVRSYYSLTDKLFVFDNSATSNRALFYELSVEFIEFGQNKGIAEALNYVAGLAFAQGYDWLLTMDQDSSFSDDKLSAYISCLKKATEETGMMGANPGYYQVGADADDCYRQPIDSVITSGSFLSLKAWRHTGFFDNNLFIDEIDHEYCYRLQNHGYKVYLLPHVLFSHQIGREETAGYAGQLFRKKRAIHSPERVYYMVRNYLYVRSLYKNRFPDSFRRRDREIAVRLKNNFFFGKSPVGVFMSICKGIRDYRQKKMGARR